MTNPHRRRTRVTILINLDDEPLLTIAIWAQHAAHNLATQLWDHGILAHVARVEIDDTTLTR